MKRLILFIAAAVLLLGISAKQAVSSDTPDFETRKEWFNINLKNSKVGYSFAVYEPSEYEGKACLKFSTYMKFGLLRMGAPVEMDAGGTAFMTKDFLPLYFKLTEHQAEKEKTVEGILVNGSLSLTINIAGQETHKKIAYEKNAIFADAGDFFARRKGLKDGENFTIRVFNPDSLTFEDLKCAIYSDKENKGGFLLHTEILGVDTVHYLDKDGNTLRSTVPALGAETVKTDEKDALAFRPSEIDIMKETCVPSNVDIKNNSAVTLLEARMTFKDAVPERLKKHIPADARLSRDGLSILFSNKTDRFREEDALQRPVRTIELTRYLIPSTYEQSADSGIIAAAVDAAGDEKNSSRAAKRIIHWVNRYLNKKNFNTGFDSAVEALSGRQGDCKDHSVLAIAMLRAAGIPARASAGLFPLGSKFYYHMWVEAYVGRWMALDPTFDEAPADAAHIKLNDGVLDETGRYNLMLDILQYFDKISLEITKLEEKG